MALSARFGADFGEIEGALSHVEVKIKSVADVASSSAPQFSRLVNEFNGAKIQAQAAMMAVAIEKVGGVSRLTSAQQAQANAVMQQYIDKARAMGTEVPPNLQKIADATKPIPAHVDSWTESVKKNAAGYLLGMASWETAKRVIGSITDLIVGAIHAYAEAEAAQKRLTQALVQQGQATPAVIRQYGEIAGALAKKSTLERDSIVQTEALLVQIGSVMPKDMKRATQAVADFSAGLGFDLEKSSRMVSKALDGNVTSLRKAGIQLSETEVAARGADAVFEAIERRVGGQAQAELETYAGKTKMMANAWKETQEALGGMIVTSPTVELALRALRDAAEEVQAGAEGVGGSWTMMAQKMGIFDEGSAAFLFWLEQISDGHNKAAGAASAQAAAIDRLRNAGVGPSPTHAQAPGPADLSSHQPFADYAKIQRDVDALLTPALVKLTAQQEKWIASLLQANVSVKEISETVHVSENAVSHYSEKLKASSVSTKAAVIDGNKLADAYDKMMEASKKASDQIQSAESAAARARSSWLRGEAKRTEIMEHQAALAMKGDSIGIWNGSLWDEYIKALDPAMAKQLTFYEQQVAGNVTISEGATNWKKWGGVAASAFSEASRAAEMAGKKTMSAVMSIASATAQGLAQGGPIGAVAGFAMSTFAALSGAIFKSEGRRVNDLRDEFIAASGGLAALNAKAHAAGMTLDALLKANKVKDYEAAVKALNARFQTQVDLTAQIADTQQRLDAARAASIPAWETISGIMEKYKISIEGAGAAAQQLMVSASARGLLNEWQQWVAAGLDLSVFAKASAADFSKVVQQAQQFGSVLPENMKSTVQTLIEQGLLLNAAGRKITDISDVQFGDALQTEQEKLAEEFDRLTLALQDLTTQLATLAGNPPVVVAATGRGVLPGEPTGRGYEWAGGQARGGDYLVTRPTLFLAGEAGPERATFSPRGSSSKAVTQTEGPVTFNFELHAVNADGMRDLVDDYVIPRITESLRGNRRATRTNWRASLGVH